MNGKMTKTKVDTYTRKVTKIIQKVEVIQKKK